MTEDEDIRRVRGDQSDAEAVQPSPHDPPPQLSAEPARGWRDPEKQRRRLRRGRLLDGSVMGPSRRH